MLRCPPSRLDLTAAEVRDFERRCTMRQSTWPHRIAVSNLQLNAGPERATHHAIIPERSNLAQLRAVSSSSSATNHSTENDSNDTLGDDEEEDMIVGQTESEQALQRAHPIATPRRSVASAPFDEISSVARSGAPPPPLLSSARARRRHDFPIAEETQIQQFIIEGWNNYVYRRPHGVSWSRDVPELPAIMLPQDSHRIGTTTLDPGAAVFIPNIRMASTGNHPYHVTVVSDMQSSSRENTNGSAHLRIRSEPEQNFVHLGRHLNARQEPSEAPEHGVMNRSRAVQTYEPNLERYPLLRPTLTNRQGRIGTHRSADIPSRQMSRMSSAYFLRRSSSRHWHVRRVVSTPFNNAVQDATTIAALSSGTLVNSLSSPNLGPPSRDLPVVQLRTSSLGWRDGSPHAHRPSFLSSTSQTSSDGDGRWVAQPSVSSRGSNVAAEILQMRQSPLDELAERLSRLASTPRYRRGERYASSGSETRGSQPVMLPVIHDDGDAVLGEVQTSPQLIPLPGESRLSPTDPEPASIGLSSSLPLTDVNRTSPPFVTKSSPRPQAQSTEPNPMRTPRVKVYDDAQSPSTQPQTPAEIQRRGRADTFAGRVRQVITRRVALTSPTEHSQQPLANPISPNRPDPFPESSRRERTRRRRRINHEDTENELEGHLSGLQHDHTIWANRREGGTLDVTPPREGRFEQYFS